MLTAELQEKVERAKETSVSFEAVDWSLSACRRLGSGAVDLFFSEDLEEIAMAKALCAECPVAEECFALAVVNREPVGVWGGQLFVKGVPLAVKRSRGRPRKDEDLQKSA